MHVLLFIHNIVILNNLCDKCVLYSFLGMDCDKDAKDLLRMRLEKTMRDGTDTEVDRLYDFAAFEKYSNVSIDNH